MKKHVILHGHFYQPPREDPWTGLVEHQESAAPYQDWNHRITAECYAASGFSRILDGYGSILSIRNNYENLSFNFGPTLLSWLAMNAPNVYERILDADRKSLARLGYGNAMAQSYNHTILPLNRPEDALTQIRWGLADFSHRFKREADGMWLPECAVSDTVIDLLIAERIRFIVLSPWQAEAVRNERGSWTKLKGTPAPSDRPFFIRRPEGDIAVFFYHPELASGISFGHLLRSREGLEAALRGALVDSGGSMVSIATDGEIYGHHEPFGDMCLSALIDHLGADSDLCFTNFAAYLASHPPVSEVRLNRGDDGLGTSWSCIHGVGRWMRDCGCSTGGGPNWNQAWRAPLRAAFDSLQKQAEPEWTRQVKQLTGEDPRTVLDDYGRVLSGAISPVEFASAHNVADGNTQRLLLMLEGARYLQFMYTSCGWFFSELSGIEPLQNMRYAYRAAELIDAAGSGHLPVTLNRMLSHAMSNLTEMGDGSRIMKSFIVPEIPPDARAAALFFWRHLYDLPGRDRTRWGYREGRGLTRRTVGTDNGSLMLEGEISYFEPSTHRSSSFKYRTVLRKRLFCPDIEILMNTGWIRVPIMSMPMRLRMEIQKTLLLNSEKRLKKFHGSGASERLHDLQIVRSLNLPFGASGWQSLELSLHYGPMLILDRLEALPAGEWSEHFEVLDELLKQREIYGIGIDTGGIESHAGRIVSDIAGKLQKHSDHLLLEQLVSFLEIIQTHGLRPLKPYVQNMVYSLLVSRFDEDCDTDIGVGECPSDDDLLDLAGLVNINPERFLSAIPAGVFARRGE